MFAIRSVSRAARSPAAARFMSSGEKAGATASSSTFEAREKSQEAMFVRQREMEKLAALRKKSEADIKAQEEKIAALFRQAQLEKEHAANEKK